MTRLTPTTPSAPTRTGRTPTLVTSTRGEIAKVTSLASTYTGAILAIAAVIGIPAMMALRTTLEAPMLAVGSSLGLMIAMTMCAIMATTDLQHGTARLSRWADPVRWHGFGAKVLTAAGLGALLGLISGLGLLAIGVASGAVDSLSPLVLRSALGQTPVFALGCAASSAVGLLIGRTGTAVAAVIMWVQLVEVMLPGLPTIGEQIRSWLPFMNAFMFTMPDNFADPRPAALALGYFAAFCVGVIAIAAVVVDRRDI